MSHQTDYFELPTSPQTNAHEHIPVYVGGSTAASCRRAVELGDGWMPARINLATFGARIEYLINFANKPANRW